MLASQISAVTSFCQPCEFFLDAGKALVCTLWSPTGSLEVLGATGWPGSIARESLQASCYLERMEVKHRQVWVGKGICAEFCSCFPARLLVLAGLHYASGCGCGWSIVRLPVQKLRNLHVQVNSW